MLVDFLDLRGESKVSDFDLNILGNGLAFLSRQKAIGLVGLWVVGRARTVGGKENVFGFEVAMNKMPFMLESRAKFA